MEPTSDFQRIGRSRIRTYAVRMAAVASCLGQMVVAVGAVGDNKALYVGGSSKEVPSARNRVMAELEGTLSTQSQSELVFDAGPLNSVGCQPSTSKP